MRQRWLLAIGRTEDTVVSQVRMHPVVLLPVYMSLIHMDGEHAEMHVYAHNFACFVCLHA
ncbi:unnamed protein product [Wuchereria bancrofti]|uniref:Uncharacterized protein n=1 Tax=Wuchereria bancrofti TaxID=6293 RepID=A0A3P7FRT6_WUCBA|nr:unnamed protein product [Wuchereria bancrofti]